MRTLLLTLALLLFVAGSTSAALHDVVHVNGEHNESCGVFHSFPQTIDGADAPCIQPLTSSADEFLVGYINPVTAHAGRYWLGRAPPNT